MALPSSAMSVQYSSTAGISGNSTAKTTSAAPGRLLRCDPIIFQNCPVKPGYCPFCLGNLNLSPIQRMEQYLDMSKWYDHVQGHLSYRKLLGKFHCRHPACTEVYGPLMELACHLEDTHCFKPHRGKKRSLDL